MSGITSEQIDRVFQIFDADGSGFVEVEELGFALQALGFGVLAKAMVDELVIKHCPEGTVQVDLNDFTRIVRSRCASRDSNEEALRSFELIGRQGRDGTSAVTVEDLIRASRETGELRDGDLANEKRLRRMFERVVSVASSTASPSLDAADWVHVMRDSVSEKGNRISDTSSYDIRTRAKVANRGPYGVRVQAGKTYFYCTCGLSKTQPFCDGSHVTFNATHGTSFEPIRFVAEQARTVWFCGCKQSKTMPLCDGTHTMLPVEVEK